MTEISGIPVLSMADFDGRRGAFTERIGQGWREFGFVAVRDHGIDQEVIESAYAAFRALFALPARSIGVIPSCEQSTIRRSPTRRRAPFVTRTST